MAGRKRKNNAEYFSHDSSMRNDAKVKALRHKFGIQGYAFWCMFLEVLCDKENFIFERTDISIMLLSGDFGFDEDSINEMMDYLIKLELLSVEGNKLFSRNLILRLEPLLHKRNKMRAKYKNSIPAAEIPIPETEIEVKGNSCGRNNNSSELPTAEIPQRKGKERKGKVKKKLKKKETTFVYDELFLKFYSQYPKKLSKKTAAETFKKINPDEKLFLEIMEGLNTAKNSNDWIQENGKYIPHPSTWLNARRWEDEHDNDPPTQPGFNDFVTDFVSENKYRRENEFNTAEIS